MGANTKLFGICLLVLMNNIAWYYASETKRSTKAQAQDIINKESASQKIATTTNIKTQQATKTAPAKITNPSEKTAPIAAKTSAPVTAPRPQELEANLPMRASEDLVADQAFSKETFSFDDQAQKIATIEQLAPQGEDFIFLQNIIASNEAEAVKIAALERLNGQHHFGALNTALSVLNKDNANLSLAALNIVKNSRDTSLIPQLRTLALNTKNETLQQEINATIGQLENGLSMGMDFAHR